MQAYCRIVGGCKIYIQGYLQKDSSRRVDPENICGKELARTHYRTEDSVLFKILVMDKQLQANRSDPELESYREKVKRQDINWTVEDGLLL
jgi:hypothetical protein